MILCCPFFDNTSYSDLLNGYIYNSGNVKGVVSGGVSSATGGNLVAYAAAQNNIQPQLVTGFSGVFGSRLGTANTTYYSSAIRDTGGFNLQWSSNGTESWSGTSAGASIMALWKDGNWHNTAFSFDSFTAGNALYLCDNLRNTGTYTGKTLWNKGQLIFLQGYSGNYTHTNFLYFWNKALSESMLRAVMENPWQIFQPARSAEYFDFASIRNSLLTQPYAIKNDSSIVHSYAIFNSSSLTQPYGIHLSSVLQQIYSIKNQTHLDQPYSVFNKVTLDSLYSIKTDIELTHSYSIKNNREVTQPYSVFNSTETIQPYSVKAQITVMHSYAINNDSSLIQPYAIGDVIVATILCQVIGTSAVTKSIQGTSSATLRIVLEKE